jgi:hypothetical protein
MDSSKDELSEREISDRMDRGLRRLATMPPMPHGQPRQKKKPPARKVPVHKAKSRA